MIRRELLFKRLERWWWPFRAQVVKELGGFRDERVIPYLIMSTQKGGPQTRLNAVNALSQWDRWDVINALGKALDDPKRHIRKAAVIALGEIGGESAVNALLPALNDLNIEVKLLARFTLGNMSEDTVAPLLEQLDDALWETRNSALDFLLKIPDERVFQKLIPMMLKDSYPALRDKALKALITHRVPLNEPLLAAIKDPDPWIRAEAARIMGTLGEDWIQAPLLEALTDENHNVQVRAIWALSQRHLSQCFPQIKAGLNNDVKEVRKEVLTALGKSSHPEAVSILIAALDDKSPVVSSHAAKLLGDIRAIEAAEQLYAKVKARDGSWDSAAVALAEIGDARAFEPLLELTEYQTESALEALVLLKSKLPHQDKQFLCLGCFHRAKKFKLSLLETTRLQLKTSTRERQSMQQTGSVSNSIFYVCRHCNNNIYFIENISKVVLLLNHDFKETYTTNNSTVTINWYKKQEPVDYDEIMIMNGDDYDIEKLVMVLVNDMDKTRQKRRANIPVRISPAVNLSPAKMNLIKDHFKVKIL